MAQTALPRKSPATWGAIAFLLIIAIAGTLWVPLYARSMTGALCWICYLLAKNRPPRDAGPRDGRGARR